MRLDWQVLSTGWAGRLETQGELMFDSPLNQCLKTIGQEELILRIKSESSLFGELSLVRGGSVFLLYSGLRLFG